jgi:hypothetical protein
MTRVLSSEVGCFLAFLVGVSSYGPFVWYAAVNSQSVAELITTSTIYVDQHFILFDLRHPA